MVCAQNLGDEGTAYVVEALAFNNACLALDLSKNGIGKMGFVALCEVRGHFLMSFCMLLVTVAIAVSPGWALRRGVRCV